MSNSTRYWSGSLGRTAKVIPVILRIWLPLAMLLVSVTVPAWARDTQHEKATKQLGSLVTSGGVEVNGAAAPAESTLFAGDSVTTREDGNATLTISGKGEFDIGPTTQVVFADDPRYLAQLTRGTVTFSSLAEHSNLGVRTGDYIVTVPPDVPSQTAATVERESDGSGLVSCTIGSVQVVAMEGDTSLALRAGQSTSLASEGGQAFAARTPSDPILAEPHKVVKKHLLRTFLIIAAGAGAAAGIVLATHH
jgi:hypothetical protein